jgi:MFS family permease
VPRWAARLGGRQVVGLGFAVTTIGFAVIGFVTDSWAYSAFVLPLIAIAIGMGMSNGPASAASTSSVPVSQVGEASGVSNMARYVGAAVATAIAATVYSQVTLNRSDGGTPTSSGLAAGVAATAWVMAIFSVLGVLMAVVMGRRARAARGTLADAAAAAAAGFHTVPTTTQEDSTLGGAAAVVEGPA